jgi:hypothetical protein
LGSWALLAAFVCFFGFVAALGSLSDVEKCSVSAAFGCFLGFWLLWMQIIFARKSLNSLAFSNKFKLFSPKGLHSSPVGVYY